MEHPIRLVATHDLERTRLTVAFRLILVIPHLIWLALWGIAATVIAIINWFATLFSGTSPVGLHNFLAQYLRYATHVHGYILFLADPYPGFMGTTDYDADLVIAPPAPQNRWITGFRFIMIIPAAIVSNIVSNLVNILAVFAWFVCLFTGALPGGLRSIIAWAVRFQAQTAGYGLLLTDRYPEFSTEGID